MKLNPPRTITWLVALIIGAIGIAAKLGGILGDYAFWLVVIGFGILVFATLLKGL
jgi:hypothetical protein